MNDVQYAIPISLGTPTQTLYLTVDFEQYKYLLVAGVPVSVYTSRSFYRRSLSGTFSHWWTSKDAVFGRDKVELDGGKAYNATTLQVVTDVDQARQLYDRQLFDGFIAPNVMFRITGASLYTFDLRRACTSGRTESAGNLVYGDYDTAGCAGFSPVPTTQIITGAGKCQDVTYLSITNVAAGSTSVESSLTSTTWSIALNKEDITLPPVLFEPIRATYNARLDNDSRYVVKCDVEYPPVTLTINGSHKLTIDYWNMVYRLNDVCYLRASHLLPDVDDNCGRFYIGIPLFHQYCLAFNLISGPYMAPLKVARKRSANSSVCTYVPLMTTAFPATTIGGGHLNGLSAGSVAGIVVACILTLCSIIAAFFFGCRHREEITRSNDNKQPVLDEWLLDGDELQFDSSEILGTGHFSTVFKGALKNWRLTGRGNQNAGSSVVVAVKVPNVTPNVMSEDIWREIQRHKELITHVHVVQMLGYKAANALRPVIIFEYCSEGDLLKWLHRQRERAEQFVQSNLQQFDYATYLRQQISVAWQVSDGMTFVSSRGIVHRDLAARNIFLAEGLVAKVGDFGLARNASDNVYPNRSFGRLPVKRMAPESLKYGSFNKKSDVWSFGLLLSEIFSSGVEPFCDVEPERMLAAIEDGVRPSKPKRCPDEIHTISENCCDLDPEQRPTFHKLRDALAYSLEKTVAHDGYLSFGTHVQTTADFTEEFPTTET